jgi:hypothetical protein
MVTQAQLKQLAYLGWPVMVRERYDICWLDCSRDGWLKTSDDGLQVICLCPVHALVLETGAFDGDYAGAILPPDSMAMSWPWRSSMDLAEVPT